MPRTARAIRAGVVYHVLNRGNGRCDLFHKPADFDAFLRVLAEALRRYPVDLFAYCLMSNHWHLVLRPRPLARADASAGARSGPVTGPASGSANSLARMMGWLGVTHVRRHHEHYHTRGGGHLYQGRFKSFPVRRDRHFLLACRYAEANPLRAGLVARAQDWPYSSVRWSAGIESGPPPVPLARWPPDRPGPADWLACVNEPLEQGVLEQLRTSANRGRPFGDDRWAKRTAARLGLAHTFRDPGRPPKRPKAAR